MSVSPLVFGLVAGVAVWFVMNRRLSVAAEAKQPGFKTGSVVYALAYGVCIVLLFAGAQSAYVQPAIGIVLLLSGFLLFVLLRSGKLASWPVIGPVLKPYYIALWRKGGASLQEKARWLEERENDSESQT